MLILVDSSSISLILAMNIMKISLPGNNIMFIQFIGVTNSDLGKTNVFMRGKFYFFLSSRTSFFVYQEENTSETDTIKESNQDDGVTQNNNFPEFPSKDMNRRIALTSTAAAVGLFLSRRLDFGFSLKDLAAASTPYEEVNSSDFYIFIIYVLACLPTNI